MAQVRHVLAGLETLWVEEIAELQEVIAAQQLDGLARGLNELAVEAEVMASYGKNSCASEIPDCRGDAICATSHEIRANRTLEAPRMSGPPLQDFLVCQRVVVYTRDQS